jgi:hypothetical protein
MMIGKEITEMIISPKKIKIELSDVIHKENNINWCNYLDYATETLYIKKGAKYGNTKLTILNHALYQMVDMLGLEIERERIRPFALTLLDFIRWTQIPKCIISKNYSHCKNTLNDLLIGCLQVKVELVDYTDIEGDTGYDGTIDYNDLTIYIRKGLSDEKFIETLLHECLHAIDVYSKGWLGVDEPFEEEAVKALTFALIRFFRDNPKLTSFFATSKTEYDFDEQTD